MPQQITPEQIAGLTTSTAIMMFSPGKPTANQVFARFVLPFAFTPQAALSGGTQKTAPSSTSSGYVISLYNASDVLMATWTWGAGATTPVVSLKVSTIPAGTYRFQGQATVDSTFEDPTVTIGGVR